MDNLLHHPARIALALGGILLALAAFTFFGAPVMMLPAVPLIIRFIGSARRSLAVVGWGLVVLVIVSFSIERTEIENSPLEKFVVFGAPLLMLSAFIHLLASRTTESPKIASKDEEAANKSWRTNRP